MRLNPHDPAKQCRRCLYEALAMVLPKSGEQFVVQQQARQWNGHCVRSLDPDHKGERRRRRNGYPVGNYLLRLPGLLQFPGRHLLRVSLRTSRTRTFPLLHQSCRRVNARRSRTQVNAEGPKLSTSGRDPPNLPGTPIFCTLSAKNKKRQLEILDGTTNGIGVSRYNYKRREINGIALRSWNA